MDRATLPFRKNCEGYFFDGRGNVLAQDTGKGYLLFPGGGVDKDENPAQAIARETLEETGFVVTHIRRLGAVRYVWPPDWPVTSKQKARYQQFQGEEMTFFTGELSGSVATVTEEDAWTGEKFMPIADAIAHLAQRQPFTNDLAPYYTAQLRYLRMLTQGD